LAVVAVCGGLAGPSAQSARVQVGWCAPLKSLAAARQAGFDYVELGTTEIAGLPDTEFDQAVEQIRQAGLPVPVTNLFLPATLKVTGPAIDPDAQMAYVRKAFARLSRIGTEIVVFGSGGARRVPDGGSRPKHRPAASPSRSSRCAMRNPTSSTAPPRASRWWKPSGIRTFS
jgi:sugar phosphate isomerase/epimerase